MFVLLFSYYPSLEGVIILLCYQLYIYSKNMQRVDFVALE